MIPVWWHRSWIKSTLYKAYSLAKLRFLGTKEVVEDYKSAVEGVQK